MNIRVLSLTLLSVLTFLIQGNAYARIADKAHTQRSLVFVENKGQITDQNHNVRKDIDFKLNAPGIDIFIGKGQLHYQWSKSIDSITSESYRLDVFLVGANTNATIITEEGQGYYENYYLPQCTNGATAHSYKKITYKNIYPNIDWVLYLNANVLKYDFIVHDGGNTTDIKIQYKGATALQLLDGALQVTTPFGSITEHAPYSYNAKTKEKINSSYKLNTNTLSFNIENTTGEIVIDPQLDWATYYGGSLKEGATFGYTGPITAGNIIAVDGLGDVYIVGNTQSTNNIATVGAYSTTVASQDGFIAKFNAIGSRLWGTYYGGNNFDGFSGVVTASDNTVYVAGITQSKSGIATTGSHQFIHGDTAVNGSDGMLIKFDATGQRIWGTYYGGIDQDWIRQVAISASDDIYITGGTFSRNNIVTPGAFQTYYGNAFLAKFNSAGARQWGTYFIDSMNAQPLSYGQGLAVECDKNNDVYFSGVTLATSGIATANAHQKNIRGGRPDAFLAKFNATGQRIWCTYYGGIDNDFPTDIACDDSLNVYLCGSTSSMDSISTPGSYQEFKPSGSGVASSFGVKFTKDGVRNWGTYFDGNTNAVLIDAIGDVCFAGRSGNPGNNITTSGAWQSNVKGSNDATYIKLDKSGARLWATYYGSNGNDEFSYMTKTPSNNIYFLGYTESFFGISTPGSYQTSYGGNGDIFLVKSTPDSVVYIDPVDTLICIPPSGSKSIRVYYTLSRSFRPGNVITVQLSDSNGSFLSPFNIGSAASTASGYVDCTLTSAIPFGKRYRMRVLASSPFYISNDNGKNIEIRQGPEKPEAWGDTSVCAGDAVRLFANCATAGVSYSWVGPAFGSFIQNPVIPSVNPNGTGNYIVTVSPAICKMKDTVHVTVRPLPKKPVVVDYAPICEGSKLTLTHSADTGNIFYVWYRPSLLADTTDSLVIPAVKRDDAGDYVLVINRGGCINADTVNVVVKRIPVLSTWTNSPLRVGSDLFLNGDVDSGSATYLWKGPFNYSSNEGHTVRKSIDKNAAGAYTIMATVDGCSTSKQILVVVDDGLKPSEHLEINPNPNKGTFTLSGILLNDQVIPLEVVSALGQTIYTTTTITIDKRVEFIITLSDVAQGEYFLRLRVGNKNKTYRFIISK